MQAECCACIVRIELEKRHLETSHLTFAFGASFKLEIELPGPNPFSSLPANGFDVKLLIGHFPY